MVVAGTVLPYLVNFYNIVLAVKYQEFYLYGVIEYLISQGAIRRYIEVKGVLRGTDSQGVVPVQNDLNGRVGIEGECSDEIKDDYHHGNANHC